MPSPRIVKETKKQVQEFPPPVTMNIEGIDPAEWSISTWVDLYISKHAAEKMIRHCNDYADRRLEVMGLLVGDIYKWKGKVYSVVEDTVTSRLQSTSISVKFNPATLEELAKALDEIEFEYMIVGWYHSHPGLTCFLSDTDIETGKRNFDQPYHSSIVIDPLNREMKAYQIEGMGYYEKPFLVYTGERYRKKVSTDKVEQIIKYIDILVDRQIHPDKHHPPAAVPAQEEAAIPASLKKLIEDDLVRQTGPGKK